MAQTAAESATILDWDGSTLGKDQPLFMHVGDTLPLKYNLFPADADPNSVHISTHGGDDLNRPCIRHEDGKVYALYEGTGYVYVIPNTNEPTYLDLRKVVVSNKDFLLYGDSCGDHVVCTLTDDGELSFWRDEVGNSTGTSGTDYWLWDFAYPNDAALSPTDHIAPWFEYMNKVRTINTNNITFIGSNAFRDLPEIKYVRISDDITVINENVFLGSLNLGTVEMRGYPPYIENSSFLLDAENGLYVPTIIVPAALKDEYNETVKLMYKNLGE